MATEDWGERLAKRGNVRLRFVASEAWLLHQTHDRFTKASGWPSDEA